MIIVPPASPLIFNFGNDAPHVFRIRVFHLDKFEIFGGFTNITKFIEAGTENIATLPFGGGGDANATATATATADGRGAPGDDPNKEDKEEYDDVIP
ncbi:hypothetical protein L1887_19628 [Cichorium endivia]|nr:hypothetical protein L1887_19628 [Cichorium endivia]